MTKLSVNINKIATIRNARGGNVPDVLQAAKALSLNTSQAAEAGIRDAVREALTDKWLADNAAAISAYNADLEARGPAIPVLWAKR